MMENESNIQIPMTWDQVDSITVDNLRGSLETIESDLKQWEEGTQCGVFSTDKTTDVALLKQYKEAFELVIGWYA